MKILLIADVNSPHTIKWTNALISKGVKVSIFTLSASASEWYIARGIEVYHGLKLKKASFNRSTVSKIKYLRAVPLLKRFISELEPDVIHAHYATSYGLIGTLSGFHPIVITMYGSDIYNFPQKSFIHKFILKRNLSKADKIVSLSQVMALKAGELTSREISITHFGVDTSVFRKLDVGSVFSPGDIVVGTIKSMEPIYGIDILIRAFKAVRDRHTDLPLKLLIVGEGSQMDELQKLVSDLDLTEVCVFTGKVSYEKIAEYHNMLSVYVSLSEYESFGVAALEASACETPVITSDADGFTEVVDDGVTGYRIVNRDFDTVVIRLEELVVSDKLRTAMGKAGRKWVEENFDLSKGLNETMRIYQELTGQN